jgi:hypothetical protein
MGFLKFSDAVNGSFKKLRPARDGRTKNEDVNGVRLMFQHKKKPLTRR